MVDFFARSPEEFLVKNGLVKGATNFMSRKKLDALHETLADSVFTKLPGDNARNVCEGVAHLGGKSVYAGSVGEDSEGSFFASSLKKHRVNSLLSRRPGRTGKIIVLITPDGQRTFAVDLGNSLDHETVSEESLKKSRFLYLTSITLLSRGKLGKTAKRALKTAEGAGVKVALSLESPPMIAERREELLKPIERVNIMFGNEEELEALVGAGDEAARQLCEKLDLLCLKRGESGSTIFTKNETFTIPRYSKKTVDTTGAGDFYAAGLIYGLCREKSVEEAGHLGAKLAGKVVERFGATVYKS